MHDVFLAALKEHVLPDLASAAGGLAVPLQREQGQGPQKRDEQHAPHRTTLSKSVEVVLEVRDLYIHKSACESGKIMLLLR
jgi:hypothetical protein